MRSVTILGFLCFICALGLMPAYAQSTIEVTGGGDDKLTAAIQSAAAGDTILIKDSATYNETYVYLGIGKAGLTIKAAFGANPQINFSSTADGHAWCPSANLQIGSQDGGQITFRRAKAGFSPLSGLWLPAGAKLRISNCVFTGAGEGGPWNGSAFWSDGPGTTSFDHCKFIDFKDQNASPEQAVINSSPWNAGTTINLTDCQFKQTAPATVLTAVKAYYAGLAITVNARRCTFENYARFFDFDCGTLNVTECLFKRPTEFGFHIYNHGPSVTITKSAFCDLRETGDFYIWIPDTTAPLVTIDHCDFAPGAPSAPSIGAGNGTNAQITVTNCNIGASPMLWGVGVGASFQGSYSYCNLFGTTVEAIYTDAGHNLNPGTTPDYADLTDAGLDMTYTTPALLVADSTGGALGSMFRLADMNVPVELSSLSAE